MTTSDYSACVFGKTIEGKKKKKKNRTHLQNQAYEAANIKSDLNKAEKTRSDQERL